MEVRNVPFLCFGTFFTLLLQQGVEELSSKDRAPMWREPGHTDNHINERAAFVDLNRIVAPSYLYGEKRPDNVKGVRDHTSKFKSCQQSRATKLPIVNTTEIHSFIDRWNSDYDIVANAMYDFIQKFIHPAADKRDRLVKSLIELIRDATNVEDDMVFYINGNSVSVTRQTIININSVSLPDFLLGLFRFILENEINNKEGLSTYNEWCPEAAQALRTFASEKYIGLTIKHGINIFCDKREAPNKNVETDTLLCTKEATEDLDATKKKNGFKIKSNVRGQLSYCEKIVSIPLKKNFDFIGRSKYLRDILKKFNEAPDGIPPKQTISGLGGVGKTQLALQYAYENIDNYDVVCWVECTSEAAMIRSCESFLSQAGVSIQANIKALFTHWFQSHSSWLLIFDDVGVNSSIDGFLPKIGKGHILVTTHQTNGDVIPLDAMGIDEAVGFILKRTGTNDLLTAKSVAARLGRFPLALEQAAAYVNEIKINLNEYLELINKYGLDVFDKEDEVECYNRNIRTVWSITLEKLSDTERQLLYCFAYMSSDIITLDWLVEHARKLHAENQKPDKFVDQIGNDGKSNGNKENVSEILRKFINSKLSPDLIAILTNDAKRNNTIRKLVKYSLITIKKDNTITMHSLLQEVIRKNITDPMYLLSVWEVFKSKISNAGLIYNDYHIALPYDQAKAMILNAKTLLSYGNEYKVANVNPNTDMWELHFDFYSLFAQYLTLWGIDENNKKILLEADKCYATACEIGTPLYGGGEDSDMLSGASTFTVIQEKHRRVKVNLILGRVDVARKIYAEVRAPVSKSLKQEPGMSFHAFANFGDLWYEFGFFAEAKECYEFALKVGLSDKEEALLEKIDNCKNGGSYDGK